MTRTRPVYRDGRVHVLAAQCATCIFRPGNLMQLQRGRVAEMLKTCIERDTIIPCHEWMDTKTPAVCRGLFDTGRVAVLQIAERLGVITFQEAKP